MHITNFTFTVLLSEGNVACLLPYDKGPCEALNLRWYYSAQDGFCRDFLFGGCEGNANNFATQEMCEAECRYFSVTKGDAHMLLMAVADRSMYALAAAVTVLRSFNRIVLVLYVALLRNTRNYR